MVTGEHPFMAETSSGVLELNAEAFIDFSYEYDSPISQEEQILLESMIASSKEERCSVEELVR